MKHPMLRRFAFAIVTVTVLVSALACGGSDTSPSPMPSPTPSPALDLTGTWLGTFHSVCPPDCGNVGLPFRWIAAANDGVNFTGPTRLSSNFGPAAGTMEARLSGTQATVKISFPAGAFTAWGPRGSTCTMNGESIITASATMLSGVIRQAIWTEGCAGILTDGGVARNVTLTLSK